MGAGRHAGGRDACILGRLAKSAFATRAQDIPLLHEKLDALLGDERRAASNSHAYRETRAMFNHFPKRELLYSDVTSLKAIIDRMVYMAGDDEIAVTTRKGRGYSAALIAFTDTRYSRKAEEELKDGAGQEFGPISFNTWADCGTTACWSTTSTQSTLERPLDESRGARPHADDDHDLGGPGRPSPSSRPSVRIEGRRLFKKYVRTESRSGLYRESTKPEEVPADLVRLEQLEGRLELSMIPLTRRDGHAQALLAARRSSLTETLRTLQNLKPRRDARN